jgi:hypothetical protein
MGFHWPSSRHPSFPQWVKPKQTFEEPGSFFVSSGRLWLAWGVILWEIISLGLGNATSWGVINAWPGLRAGGSTRAHSISATIQVSAEHGGSWW